MTAFFAHASSEDGKFEASGFSHGTAVTISGSCEQDSDGNISVVFTKQYAKGLNTEYISGHLLPDGSIRGTQGWDSNSSEHQFSVVLRRVSEETIRHRPPVHEFAQNRIRALWKFATEAILAQVRKRMWSWSYFADRRDRRNDWTNIQIKLFHYGRPITLEETLTRARAIQHMTTRDASFVYSRYEYLLRIIPKHQCAPHTFLSRYHR